MSEVERLIDVGLSWLQALHLGETYATALTATGNASQSNAYQLDSSVSSFSTVTAAANSAKLPSIALSPRSSYWVINKDAADTLNVFPASGESINDLAADLSVTVAPGESRLFIKFSSSAWHSVTYPLVSDGNNVTLGGDLTVRDDLDVAGTLTLRDDLLFTGAGSGLAFGTIYVNDNSTATVITASGEANKVKFAHFNTNGESHLVTPDHTNDRLTVAAAGVYLIGIAMTIESVAGPAAKFGMRVYKNGATAIACLHAHNNIAGGGSVERSAHMSCIAPLAANDYIELFIYNETGTEDVILSDVNFWCVKLGGA